MGHVEDGHVHQEGWLPLPGSWEEAVLTWNEQIEASFRRQQEAAPGRNGTIRPLWLEIEASRGVRR